MRFITEMEIRPPMNLELTQLQHQINYKKGKAVKP